MDDTMVNPMNEAPRPTSPDPNWGAFSERITNLNRRQTDFEAETRASFRSVESAMDKMATEMRSGLANLSTNLADRNRPQWTAISVALSFAVIIGGMAYWPIRETTSDLKAAILEQAKQTAQNIKDLDVNTVSRQEMDWRSSRSIEDRARIEGAIADIRANLVPRTENERVWQFYEQRLADQQRQIDRIREGRGSPP
ncbi:MULTISPECIES: hypothetical protein [Phyllobacteriaceae]|jgi:hypothetical protein|uniref:Uncharacterized protein n=1 Tax=Mesorhizobium hungaricum TaxID=1566387 RepID=A0A1C2DD86_9HYPH|nr:MULTISPECIES: hypothetical protein [Mesorhizobium]MBN9235079.1 hypothetical protein [Mesorhizobium sp.]OCX12720.1 hypothetical protein QV13_24285 [Mesorhizobium hungaricum]